MIHPAIDPAREALVRQVDGVPDRPAADWKVCSRCGPRPRDGFGPDRRASDGLSSWCRACKRIAIRVRYHEGGGKELVAAQRATPESRAKARERAAARRERHAEECRAYRRTPKGRLVHGRSGARSRLREATDEARREHWRARIALYDAEIARLDDARDRAGRMP